MKMPLRVEFCILVVVTLPLAYCWTAPWFCHEYECPVYTVVSTSEEFEERLYEPSQWLTTDIANVKDSDVKDGFWKLYIFMQGKGMESTRPGLVSISKSKSQASVSFFLPSNTGFTEPEDKAIRKNEMPGFRVYVRSFGGVATADDGFNNVELLKTSLRAAGRQFDDSRFEAAGYDSPLNLINRHNEVWLYAA